MFSLFLKCHKSFFFFFFPKDHVSYHLTNKLYHLLFFFFFSFQFNPLYYKISTSLFFLIKKIHKIHQKPKKKKTSQNIWYDFIKKKTYNFIGTSSSSFSLINQPNTSTSIKGFSSFIHCFLFDVSCLMFLLFSCRWLRLCRKIDLWVFAIMRFFFRWNMNF